MCQIRRPATRTQTDPLTGKVVQAQLGSTRRLKTIFNTNVRTAFSAGKWAEMAKLESEGEEVYLKYIAVLDGKTRPDHQSKNGIILPKSDPFWQQWYPPNGWNCRCKVSTLLKSNMDALGIKPSKSPTVKKTNWTNKRTGEVKSIARGVDPAFSYNVGKDWLNPYVPKYQDFEVIGNAPRVRAFFQKPNYDLLPTGKSDAFYAIAFLRNFGLRNLNEITTFTDKTGMDIIISKELLSDSKGKLKSNKRDRGQYLNLLADAIKDPDRIEKYKANNGQIKRRYIRNLVAGKKNIGFSVFEWDVKNKAWSGQTTFYTNSEYIKDQPKGMAVYRKDPSG